VGFNVPGLYPKFDELKTALAYLGDWVKYSQGGWILWTDASLDQIYYAIKPLVAPTDQFLIAGIDLSQKQGWMPQWIWDWINGKLQPQLPLPKLPNALIPGFSQNPWQAPPPPPPSWWPPKK
jgi:hypothetical protein